MKHILISAACVLALASCATSFQAPEVKLTSYDSSKPLGGAITLVDTFMVNYREAARKSANLKRNFDIPTFLTGIGAVAATAFGAGTDVTLAASAFTALTTGGKAYYVPTKRAEIYYQAIDAFSCIQQVSLGIKPFEVVTTKDMLVALGANTNTQDQFIAIKNAALRVESIAQMRLSNAGETPDASSLAAELEKILAEKKKNEEEAEAATSTTDANGKTVMTPQAQVDANNLSELNNFIPNLQACTLRAKG